MTTKNGKNHKKLDLLEMPKSERTKLINEVREKLRQRIAETKLWQSLLEIESISINGNTIYRENEPLSGLYSENKI